ncbi:MAG TPA: winged helix-turn-helix transcriptional regulator [Candidatus Thioglobus sp.]|nr:Lrp/AsnC ligand binding domain-containing protein [Gammaproteobacteria bacterium]HIF88314.1 winged helix-turn-helix transcriptional regulator [Candidatus Thioglobus sp.]HIL21515.1 winged helix-turn-helix transcriptional regulator [Candidatus Thioglobus sp.]
MTMLDNYDHKILKLLQSDGRMTITELSNQIGLSKTPCLNRVRKLETKGYIRGYRALINHDLVNDNHIAFVQIKMDNTKTQALNAFNAAIMEIPEVVQCHMIASHFDYLLKVRTNNMESYRKVLGEKISALPHVQSSSTFVVMEEVKSYT